MREIGSEFWDITLGDNDNGVFPVDTRWYISGTAALECIILDILSVNEIKKAALPSWCCSCMVMPFLKHGIEVVFYPVYMENGCLVCDYQDTNADCWLLLTYFGYTSQLERGLPEGIEIRDLTHSIFCGQNREADYYFGSLRKWTGIYTGGYAWSKQWKTTQTIKLCDQDYISLRETAMRMKKDYILGLSDSKEYLGLFQRSEEFLDVCNPMRSPESDSVNARLLNVKDLRYKRRKNAKVLLSVLRPWAIFPSIMDADCPLFVPILLSQNKRNKLRNYLKEMSIYCPIHWPIEKEHQLTDLTLDLYQRELSIVCDQRYNEEDMMKILKAIEESGLLDKQEGEQIRC